MANINTWELNQFIDIVNRSFVASQWNQLDNIMRKSWLVRIESIPMGTGWVRRIAETLARTSYSWQWAEGAPAQQAVYQYGYEKDLFISKHDLAISITYEMRSLGKNQEIIRELTNLGWVGNREIDLDLSHRLGFAWSTSYTNSRGYTVDTATWDGLALVSSVHTLTGSASTYSNQIANNPQFSKGAYASAKRLAVENTLDNLGVKMTLDYNTIYTADDEDTIIAVKELSNATADITSSNAGTYNVYRWLKHIIAPRIATNANGGVDSTKRKYWFIGANEYPIITLGIVQEPSIKTPADGNNGEDFYTLNWNFMVNSLYGICTPCARWILGSKGDWTA